MKLKKKSSLFFGVALASVTAAIPLAHASESTVQKSFEINNLISHQKKLDWELASVKDINALVEEANKESSPLNYLSEGAKQRFVESIVFTENGVGGFYYVDLESELTPTQIHEVLSLFGAQNLVPLFKNARIISDTDLLLLKGSGVSTLLSGPSGSSGPGLNRVCVELERGGRKCLSLRGSICTSSCKDG